MAREKAWWQLHKNAVSNIEQVLEATPTNQQLYGHLPPITKTIQVRRTRHAGHCWRRRDKLISDVLLWTPSHGRAKAGQPAWTYIQQLCEDTGCSPGDLPKAINDKEGWWEGQGYPCWWWWYLVISMHLAYDHFHTSKGYRQCNKQIENVTVLILYIFLLQTDMHMRRTNSIMNIIVRNVFSGVSSNPGRDCLHFT